MWKFPVIALAITAASAGAAVATAQYSMPQATASLDVLPARAGTPAKPRNGSLAFSIDAAPTPLGSLEYTLPRGARLTTQGFKAQAVVGRGELTTAYDPAPIALQVRVAGPGALTLRPLDERVDPIAGRLSGAKLTFDLVDELLVTGLRFRLGRQAGIPAFSTSGAGRKRRTRFAVSVVGCAAGRQAGSIRATAAFQPTVSITPGTVGSRCTAAPKP